MKANVAPGTGESESDEVAADIAILIQLSTAHAAQARLVGEVTDGATALESARALAGRLSPEARHVYASLAVARRLPFTVSLTGDCCSGCNMRLPSGLIGEIRRVRRLHRCPSCKRVISSSAA